MRWEDHGHGWGGGGFVLMLVMMLVIAGLIAWGLYLAFGSGRRTPPAQTGPAPNAEAILAERLARGEIDPAEYRERLDALRGHQEPPGPPPTA